MKAVTWLFGLPSSGKTTLAHALCGHLRASGHLTTLLDGDELRSGLCADLGFSDQDRAENLRRAAHVAAWLADQGHRVVCAFVTPTQELRSLISGILGPRLQLVHVDCPLEICAARDVKGLYARAATRQMEGLTGPQAPFQPPTAGVDAVRTATVSVAESLRELVKLLILE